MLNRLLTKPWGSLIWTVLIFFLLTINTGSIESVPLLGIKHLDKLVHIFLFGTLYILWALFLDAKMKITLPVLLGLFIAVSGYGIGMEFYQDLFTTREFELADIFADAAGALLGGLYIGAKNKPLWK